MSQGKSTNAKKPVTKPKKAASLVPKNDPTEGLTDEDRIADFVDSKLYDTQLTIYCALLSSGNRKWSPAEDAKLACELAVGFLVESTKEI